MKMEYYIKEVEYAVKTLLDGIWHEFDEYEKLNKKLGALFPTAVKKLQEWQNEEKNWGMPVPAELAEEVNHALSLSDQNKNLIDRIKRKTLRGRVCQGACFRLRSKG